MLDSTKRRLGFRRKRIEPNIQDSGETLSVELGLESGPELIGKTWVDSVVRALLEIKKTRSH